MRNKEEHNFLYQNVGRRAVLYGGLFFAGIGVREVGIFQSELETIQQENEIYEAFLTQSVSPKVQVTSFMPDGKTFTLVPVGNSLSQQYCNIDNDATFHTLQDAVNEKMGGTISLGGASAYLLGFSQLGADSDQIATIIEQNLQKKIDSHDLQDSLIYLSFLGDNDVLSLFMDDGNKSYPWPYYWGGMKDRIDDKAARFMANAKKIYDDLLMETKGEYSTIPSQVLAFLTPDITKLPVVKNANIPSFMIAQMKYAVLKINIATVQLSRYYQKKNRTLAFVNLYDQAITNDEVCSSDGLHPNEKGYEAMQRLGAQLFVYKDHL